jgi:DNA-binding response OmpR family regulator
MNEYVASISSPHVLIVDDDAITRTLYARALRQAGLLTLEASNGLEALELLTNKRVAVVLLDGQMPGPSGLEVVEKIRSQAHTALLPVLMVTAADELEARVAGLDAGADDYLAKPVDLEELVARVRTQLRRREAWQNAALDSRRRNSLIDELSRVTPQESAELTARNACVILSKEMGDVAIIAFGAREASVLAACGAFATTLPSGSQVDEKTEARLKELAERGPWIGPNAATRLVGPLAPAVCGVPLAIGERVIGSVLVGPAQPGSAPGEVALLATAEAAARVISLLLVPALARQRTGG